MKNKFQRFFSFAAILVIFFGFCFNNQASAQKRIYYCINENLDTLFSFETHFVWPFSDGIAAFKTKVIDPKTNKEVWRTGFIDKSGKVILPPIYDSKYTNYYGFKYGVSWVRYPFSEGFKLINKNGEVLTNTLFSSVGNFKDSLCAVFVDDAMGFVNTKGELVIECKYFGAQEFSEGLVCVKELKENSAYGFLNENGDVIIPFNFQQQNPSYFNDGISVVYLKKDKTIITKDGTVITTLPKDFDVYDHSEGFIIFSTKIGNEIKFGFLNTSGKIVIDPIYDYVDKFVNGFSIVGIGNKFGVLKKDGSLLLPVKFDHISGNCADDGIFATVEGVYKFFYNCNGFPFSKNLLKFIYSADGGKYWPYSSMNDKMGYINNEGNYVTGDIFNYVSSFSDGVAWVY